MAECSRRKPVPANKNSTIILLTGRIAIGCVQILFASLTLCRHWRKSNRRVSSKGENFYGAGRVPSGGANFLHDESGVPSERLLQAIWQHQRLQRDSLKTSDGKRVRIFHPGFVSVEGGPDFRNAVLQIGDERPRSGDVEIDLRASGWRAHGHDRNPDFQNVILHVVWEEAPAIEEAPMALSLRNLLDAPITELSLSLENESLRSLPENLRGKCCAPLRELDETKLAELLREAALVRFKFKAAQFRARAKNVGWEQTLWENLFRALGYKHNVWPMQSLAETKSVWSDGVDSVFAFQARLFGISGLLPADVARLCPAVRDFGAAKLASRKSGDSYIRELWDFWWRERDEFAGCILPRAIWKFHGLRPANHPQRRLALVAHWLADPNFISKIENWSAAEILNKKLLNSLLKIFQVERDEFWSRHWTFRSARLKKPQPLLGDARVTDLAVNVILPWLWVRAVEGKNEQLADEMERRYLAWPAAEDNSVLKLARQRLLGNSNVRVLKTAAAQQGLMQIIRDFCEHSNAVCDDCRFPGLVRGWSAPKTTTSLRASQTHR